MRKILPIFIFLCGLCAVSGAQQVPTAGATVYFYRYLDAPGPTPTIYVDGVKVEKIKHGRFFSLQLEPGEHEFHAGDKQPSKVILETGKVYYFRTEGGIQGHQTRITRVYPEQGEFDIAKLKPLTAK
jgi:hypothetical protein